MSKMQYEYTRGQIILLPFKGTNWFWPLVAFGVLTDATIITIAVLWLLSSQNNNWHEPVLVLITAVAALILGGSAIVKVQSRFQESTSNKGHRVFEEDPSTEPWLLVNHSYHEISWVPEVDAKRRAVIRNKLCRWRESRLRSWKVFIHVLSEETGTLNFRVCNWPFGSVRMLRVYKTAETDALTRQYFVFDQLDKEKVFPKTLRFLKGLEATHKPSKGKIQHNISGEAFTGAPKVTIELFPFINLSTHFSGKSKDELKSVAHSLGKLQTALSSTNPDSAILKSTEDDSRKMLLDDAKESWANIKGKIKEVVGIPNDDIYSSLFQGEEMVEKIIKKLVSANLDIKKDELILMHDVHPHNTFVDDEECVLIYDYDWLGMWSHRLTLAFATHRFTREFIRQQTAAANTSAEKVARQAIDVFVDAYLETSPAIHDPNSFKDTIGLWIAFANLQKLISISLRWAKGEPDPLHRTPERVTGEVRKFLRFLRESEKYPC